MRPCALSPIHECLFNFSAGRSSTKQTTLCEWVSEWCKWMDTKLTLYYWKCIPISNVSYLMLCFNCGNDECARVKRNWNVLFVGIVYGSVRNINVAIVLSLNFAWFSIRPNIHTLSLCLCMVMLCCVCFIICTYDVMMCTVFGSAMRTYMCSQCIYKVSMLIWYWYHSFIMSDPKTMWIVWLWYGVLVFGCTMVMQDVSINSIKPRSHTTAAAIKACWIIYSPRI